MKQIDIIQNYTHNYRFVYSTGIAAAMEIKKESNDMQIQLPLGVPVSILERYRAGGTIYIVGNEIVENMEINISIEGEINNFYDTQAVVPIITRNYTGSIYNGGYHEIKEVNVTTRTITLATPADEMVEETFNGTIVLSA